MFKTYECDCVICKSMCHAPCCGTPEEMEAIMDAGMGNRLCLDDWPGQEVDLHPALKGYEGGKAPYAVSSQLGCTFYKDGKCELHDKGLKPLGGRAAYHDVHDSQDLEYADVVKYIGNSWKTEKAKQVIERFKKDHMRFNFEITIEDEGYSAQCKEVEGIVTQGKDMIELKENIKEALRLYLEGDNDS